MPGEDPDDGNTRPPPDPLDRPWIHPSELGRAPRPGPSPQPQDHRRHWRRDLVIAACAASVGAVAAVSILGLAGSLGGDKRAEAARPEPGAKTDAARVAARVGPSIAAVTATIDGTVYQGSGVAVGNHDLLTTADVVPPSTGKADIWISTAGGNRHVASIQGRDPMTGLVLLHAPTWPAAAARWQQSVDVHAGDWVVAVGRLGAGDAWITPGVVSGVGTWMTDADGRRHAGIITADATLNDDARGGALVDRRGHVVGVLTTSADDGVAVTPGSVAGDVARQLADRGWASHGALGVRVTETAKGPSVVEVLPGTCGDRAGVEQGDLLLAVSGVPVRDTVALVAEVRRREAGSPVVLTVRRGRRTVRLGATLDDAAGAEGAQTVQPIATSASG